MISLKTRVVVLPGIANITGYFLPKCTKFHLIALSTRHKEYARDSKFSMLFLDKSYARKQEQAVKATL